MTLTFDDFDLEHSEHCVFDGVKVRALCWVMFVMDKTKLDYNMT